MVLETVKTSDEEHKQESLGFNEAVVRRIFGVVFATVTVGFISTIVLAVVKVVVVVGGGGGGGGGGSVSGIFSKLA